MSSIVNPIATRLKSHLPKVQGKFNNDYRTFIRWHHLEERLHSLQSHVTLPLSVHDSMEYESILNIRNSDINLADKRCRRVFSMGAKPFSPELKLA